jgi:acyl-CoA thioester hydrolase
VRRNRITLRVRWSEADAAGIGYYPHFFAWFVEGTLELLRTSGVPYAVRVQEKSLGLPVVEAHCRFAAPVVYDDELTLETIVAEVRTRAFRLEHTITRGDQPIASGYEVRGWQTIDRVALHTVTLSSIPAAVAAWLRGDEPEAPA